MKPTGRDEVKKKSSLRPKSRGKMHFTQFYYFKIFSIFFFIFFKIVISFSLNKLNWPDDKMTTTKAAVLLSN